MRYIEIILVVAFCLTVASPCFHSGTFGDAGWRRIPAAEGGWWRSTAAEEYDGGIKDGLKVDMSVWKQEVDEPEFKAQ